MTCNDRIDLSIVVPVYNEEDSLEPLYDQIIRAVEDTQRFEILFIDDGSTDRSAEVLRGIQCRDRRVKVVRFRRNFGQTAALSAGFRFSRGRIIVPLDADLQNDPADIPRLIEKLEEGYDIVSGWRKNRHDHFWRRKLPSRIANWLISRITGVHLHDYGCTLKAYRADSLRQIRLYGEMHRFIPALASWGGEKVAEVPVNHRPRTMGRTKYGLNRTVKVVLDLITIKFLSSFSTKPIYIFGGLGFLCFLGSMLAGLAVLYYKFLAEVPINMNRNPLLVLWMLLVITSVQFIMMGLLAEIMVRTYHESQDLPTYVIEEVLESGVEETPGTQTKINGEVA